MLGSGSGENDSTREKPLRTCREATASAHPQAGAWCPWPAHFWWGSDTGPALGDL